MSRRQQVAERRAEALAMRRAGKSYADIAGALDYASPNSASKDVHRALRGLVAEEGRALLDLERARVDEAQALAWRLATEGDPRTRVAAIREVTRLFERRAKLLGLDKAAQSEHDRSRDEAESLIGRIAAHFQPINQNGDTDE